MLQRVFGRWPPPPFAQLLSHPVFPAPPGCPAETILVNDQLADTLAPRLLEELKSAGELARRLHACTCVAAARA